MMFWQEKSLSPRSKVNVHTLKTLDAPTECPYFIGHGIGYDCVFQRFFVSLLYFGNEVLYGFTEYPLKKRNCAVSVNSVTRFALIYKDTEKKHD